MSDNQRLLNSSRNYFYASPSNAADSGEIHHSHLLSEDIGSLYLDLNYSDVTLVVKETHLPAHRVILASRSDYFRALLYGGLKESVQTHIELKDTNVGAFKILLRYIYTGRVSLRRLTIDMNLEVLCLSHRYGFVDLQTAIIDFLKAIISPSNLCQLLTTAQLYGLQEFTDFCLQYADTNANDVISCESFCTLPSSSVINLISRDSFCAHEIEIFRAIQRWAFANDMISIESLSLQQDCKAVCDQCSEMLKGLPRPIVPSTSQAEFNPAIIDQDELDVDSISTSKTNFDPPNLELSSVLSYVRLPLIKLDDLINVVRPSNLISSDVILDAIRCQRDPLAADLPFRGFSLPNVNIATLSCNAKVIEGELKHWLLNPEKTYDMENGFCRHPISEHSEGIVVQLGTTYMINNINLHLWDHDGRSYSYYVEVSTDAHEWCRIIDYSHYRCRSWQKLYFPNRIVRYIRVVGTYNSANRVFHLISLQAMFSTEKLPIDDKTNVVIPTSNVATVDHKALVIEGTEFHMDHLKSVSRRPNTLINGNSIDYDWDTGYTCHQIGSGSITVQFPQPFLISSCRLLLWDCDDRRYSFYVESSINQQDWTMVADKSHELCRSWQRLEFVQPVVCCFIRITGTHNTANEVFHCVSFECPAVDNA